MNQQIIQMLTDTEVKNEAHEAFSGSNLRKLYLPGPIMHYSRVVHSQWAQLLSTARNYKENMAATTLCRSTFPSRAGAKEVYRAWAQQGSPGVPELPLNGVGFEDEAWPNSRAITHKNCHRRT